MTQGINEMSSQRCDFAGNYERSRLPAVRALEQRVLGCDYGGTSWTTRAQAEQITESLELGPGAKLLEVGAGSGWPGLYLGKLTGSDVTLLDIPLNALKQAAKRAVKDQISAHVRIVAGSGTALPFNNAAFDRLSHSDVLCCLPEKPELLRECRRVAVPGARMHFSVIRPAPDISSSEYQEVVAGGPPFVDAPDGYAPLLRDSKWRILRRTDISSEYANSLRHFVAGLESNRPALLEAIGEIEFAYQRRRREEQIALVERGILRREAFVTKAI